MPLDAGLPSAQRDYVFVVNPTGDAMQYAVSDGDVHLLSFWVPEKTFATKCEWTNRPAVEENASGPDFTPRKRSQSSIAATPWTHLLTIEIREVLTTGPLHAVEIARKAVRDGAAAVIAVGGDGTLHEVLNGFFEDGKLVQQRDGLSGPPTVLGLIPMGTGSDLARHFGWKSNDKHQAIDRLVQGYRRRIDVGRVQLPDDKVDRYFLNVASLHLSAKAGYIASMHKKLGNLCYVLGAIQAFRTHENRDLRMRADGGQWTTIPKVTATCVGNAKYFGGGMKITPTADPFSGRLEVVSLAGFKWYDFILKMHTLYQGSHVQSDKVTTTSVQSLDVEDAENKSKPRDVFVQADGEHLGFLPAKFSILPQQIDFIL